MFRQLVGLVLLSLAAFGLSPAQASPTDEAYILESPPVIEFGELKNSGSTERVDVLQPTFSGDGNRIFYDLNVDVLTNGELDNFNVISACFFTSSAASRASERDSLCGYTPENPVVAPTDPDPSLALSMAWTTDGTFRIDGTNNSHALGDSTHETFETTRTVNSESITYEAHRLKFQFALSHAAINTSDWTARVVAVSTPTLENGTKGNPQRTEILLDANCSISYVAQVDGTDCGPPDTYGVTFFGGFSSATNRSVDYGSVNENSSSAVRTIPTASYYANDSATLSIAASNFIAGDDEISLSTAGVGNEKNKRAITLECNAPTEDNGVGQLLLDSSPSDFFQSLPASSTENNREQSKDAPAHTCQLHYGIGAAFANNAYQNVVEIGIRDADTDNGPTVNAVEITPNPSP